MNDRFERFSFAMLEIYRHWHAIAARELRPMGLKVQHALCLMAIRHYENGLTGARIAFLTGRDKADVSRSIASLAERGLVTRSDAENPYRAQIKLTEEGKALADHLAARAELAAIRGGRGIDDETRAGFYETLELIDYNLQTMAQEGIQNS